MGHSVRDSLEALEPLDLKKCRTVGELVRALGKCSFVARQLGEVAETIYRWIRQGKLYLYYAKIPARDSGPLFESLGREQLYSLDHRLPLLVVGRFGADLEFLGRDPENTIFINREGLCLPGQVGDGYFPNVVFEDPYFVMPVIMAAIEEWRGRKTLTISELFETLSQCSGVAGEVVRGARVLKAMIDDPDCTVFMTASGAMTIAQLDYLFCDMIEEGMIQYLATTGALMAHGLIKSTGLKQWKHRPEHGDALYAQEKINRVTDTLEPEENFDHIDRVMKEVLERLTDRGVCSPNILHQAIGKHLAVDYPAERGILKSAFQHQVPVCVPAFVDSEIGNDVFCFNARSLRDEQPRLIIDQELDSKLLMDLALASKKMGIFSIGGGVPRNNTQNAAPLIEIYKARLGRDDLPDRHFSYGCRICPDPMWHGHLSGCTYSENESWRKMDNAGDPTRFAEVHADATVTWPFILKWVLENRGK